MEGTSISLVFILRFLSGFIFHLLSRVLQPPPAQLWGWCCGWQGGSCCRSPTNGQHLQAIRNKGSLPNDETRQTCLSHNQIVIWICFWLWQTQPIYAMLSRWDLNVRNPIDAVFVGVDEDGSDGKAKEDESAKEGDLPDRDEPRVWLYHHTYNIQGCSNKLLAPKKTPCN